MPTEQLYIEVIFKTKGAGGSSPVPEAKALTGSVKDLEDRLRKATLAWKETVKGTIEYENAAKRVANLNNLLRKSQQDLVLAQTKTAQSTHSMGTTLQALNFTIRDSPYFFGDFSLGILAVGNNLNPLIDGLIRTSREAKVMGSTLGKQLLASLTGPAGLVFGFSVLVSVLQAVVFAMDNTDEKAKDTTENLRRINEELETYSRTKLISIKAEYVLPELTKLEQKAEKIRYKYLVGLGQSKAQQDALFELPPEFKNMTAEQIKQLDSARLLTGEKRSQLLLLREQKEAIDLILNGNTSLSRIDAEIKKLEEEKKTATRERVLIINREIERLKQLKKEYEGQYGILGRLNEQLQQIERRKAYANTTEELAELARQADLTKAKIIQLNAEVISIATGRDINLSDVKERGLFGFSILARQAESTKIGDRNDDIERRYKLLGKQISDDLNDELQIIEQISSRVGQSLYDAFIHGKLAVDQLIASLVAMAAQLVIIEGLKYALSGGILGIFGRGGAHGGIVGNPFMGGIGIDTKKDTGGLVGGDSFMSDRMLVPINTGEMVLNKAQQRNLFNAIMGARFQNISGQQAPIIIFENLLDGQKLVLKAIKQRQALLR